MANKQEQTNGEVDRLDCVLAPAIQLLDVNYRDAYQQLMARVRELEQKQNGVEVDKEVTIRLALFGGRMRRLHVKGTNTVAELKAKIEQITRIPIARKRLVLETGLPIDHQHMILPQTFCTLRDDQQTLAFYNISEGSIIHLVGMGTVGAGGAAFSIIRRRRRIRETMLRLRQFAVEEDQHEDEEEEPDDLDSTLRARALNNHLLYSDD